MSHTFFKIWIHLVWSTKDREPLLHKDIRQGVFEHIKEKAGKEGFFIEAVGGIEDHVHCLMLLPPKQSISEAVNKLKGESSHWLNANKLTRTHFAWQNGFAAFSVSESQIGKVKKYIEEQEEHHRTLSYTEEVERFLKLYKALESK